MIKFSEYLNMYALVYILLDIISNCSNNNKTTLTIVYMMVAIDLQSVVI